MLALGILVLGAFVNFIARLAGQDALANAVAVGLPFVLLAMFVFFLALQILRLFVRRSTDEDDPAGPPGV